MVFQCPKQKKVGVSSKSKRKIKIIQLLEYDRHLPNWTNLDCWVDILNKHNIQPVNILSGILGWQNFACIFNTPLPSNFSLGDAFFWLAWVQITSVTVRDNVWYFWPINWYSHVFRWVLKDQTYVNFKHLTFELTSLLT